MAADDRRQRKGCWWENTLRLAGRKAAASAGFGAPVFEREEFRPVGYFTVNGGVCGVGRRAERLTSVSSGNTPCVSTPICIINNIIQMFFNVLEYRKKPGRANAASKALHEVLMTGGRAVPG
jgi:hypothetical protein